MKGKSGGHATSISPDDYNPDGAIRALWEINMPMNNWKRVEEGISREFHHDWISEIKAFGPA